MKQEFHETAVIKSSDNENDKIIFQVVKIAFAVTGEDKRN